MPQEKPNHCTSKGECTCPKDNDDTGCRYFKPSIAPGNCMFKVFHTDKCLSPFALSEAREAA